MPVFLTYLLRGLTRARTWMLPAMVMVAVFVTSWPLMALAEPADARFTDPATYWWWFIVTASTVGYGDFHPTTTMGHVVGVYVIIGGIATLTTIFTQLAGAIENAKGRRMHGSITVDHRKHTVVLGYTPGRTERIVDEVLADTNQAVVLAAWDEVESHPMPDRVTDFVRGDLTDSDVLRRAGVHRAHTVLVDARDDHETLAVVVTVNHVAPDVHLVATLRDLEHTTRLQYVNGEVRCLQWHSPRMVTEELQSPGISQVYSELMTYGGQNTYALRLPDSAPSAAFGDYQTVMGREHDATLLAARVDGTLRVSPPWRTPVPGGSLLYYVSEERISPERLARALPSTDSAARS
ncbi:voltage-gated potassium channel [Haloactinospora alba]|uniref:Voltage-gated potassium channel n=1 Tax=Haloactinospora alba TaxID=405555 RepID=A0A543NFQ5_9ACTN|nr:NAD-binding protein [Haloactinospora alba]TQN30664.1 voltage-gated potassium channel [Haloactinospora alba]